MPYRGDEDRFYNYSTEVETIINDEIRVFGIDFDDLPDIAEGEGSIGHSFDENLTAIQAADKLLSIHKVGNSS